MNDLILIEEKTAIEAFSSDEGLESIIEKARIFVSRFKPDLTTAKSRAEITNLASKVAKFKNKLDGLGKELVSDWKSKSKAVDQNRKKVRDELDALKVIARKPLTEWEAEQDARIATEEEEQARIEQEKVDQELAENLRKQLEQDHEMALLLDEKYDREAQEEADRIVTVAAEQAERDEQQRKDQEEVARVQSLNNKMLVFTHYKTFPLNDVTLGAIKEALKEMKNMDITEEDWDSDFIDKAKLGQTNAVMGLTQMITDKEAQIEQLVELNRLKDEAQEREEQEAMDRIEVRAKKMREEDEAHRNEIHARISEAIGELDRDYSPHDIVMAIADGNIPHLKIEY